MAATHRAAIAALAMLLAALVPAHAEPPSVPADLSCTLEPGPIKTVARVLDGETVVLDDGSELRLIGALAPRARDANADEGAWPAETESVSALTRLVLGTTVQVAYGGRRTDRWGRHLGHLFMERDGEIVWVQGELLKTGRARAYVLPESTACAAELLAHEKLAREERLGLWSASLYHPKPALQTGQLMAARSSFQIVRGVVKNVSRTKSAAFINFGDDWKTDFTARAGKTVLGANGAWGAALENLTGKTVEVRGWIERRNGSLIEIADPAQITPLEDAPAPAKEPEAPAAIPADPETASAPAPKIPSELPRKPTPKQKRPEPKAPGAVNL